MSKSSIKGINKMFIINQDYLNIGLSSIITCTLEPNLEKLSNEEWFIRICKRNNVEIISTGFLFNRNRLCFCHLEDDGDISLRKVKKKYRKIMSEVYIYIKAKDINIDIEKNIVKRFLRYVRNYISDLGG